MKFSYEDYEANLARIVNSDEVWSTPLSTPNVRKKAVTKNPSKNLNTSSRLNRYVKTARKVMYRDECYGSNHEKWEMLLWDYRFLPKFTWHELVIRTWFFGFRILNMEGSKRKLGSGRRLLNRWRNFMVQMGKWYLMKPRHKRGCLKAKRSDIQLLNTKGYLPLDLRIQRLKKWMASFCKVCPCDTHNHYDLYGMTFEATRQILKRLHYTLKNRITKWRKKTNRYVFQLIPKGMVFE